MHRHLLMTCIQCLDVCWELPWTVTVGTEWTVKFFDSQILWCFETWWCLNVRWGLWETRAPRSMDCVWPSGLAGLHSIHVIFIRQETVLEIYCEDAHTARPPHCHINPFTHPHLLLPVLDLCAADDAAGLIDSWSFAKLSVSLSHLFVPLWFYLCLFAI